MLLSRFIVRHFNLLNTKVILRSKYEHIGDKFAKVSTVPVRYYGANSVSSSSSSGHDDSNEKFVVDNKKLESLMSEEDILCRPVRERFGITKSMMIIVLGVYCGAVLAMLCAHVLEELDIFIDDDLDDD